MMRYLSIVLLSIFSALNLTAQTVPYRISGTAPDDVKTMLLNTVNNKPIDTVEVVDGRFVFEGSMEQNTFLTVLDAEGMYPTNVIVDGQDVEIDLATGRLKGSRLNERFHKIDVPIMDLEITYMQDRMDYWQADRSNSSQRDSLRKVKDSSYSKMLVEMKNAIRGNADNVIPALYLSQIYNVLELDELKAFLQNGQAYAEHPLLRNAWRLLSHREKTNVGQMYTDLQENDTLGVPHKLSEYVGKGNYVLVDFWASWCAPCMAEMPNLRTCYERYHSKGFEIVGLSFDSSRLSWVTAIKRYNLNWIHLSDLKYWDSNASWVYGISSIPANLLLDGEGRIVATDLRGDELARKLHEIYSQP